MNKRLLSIAAIVVLIAMLAGCAGTPATTTTTTAPAANATATTSGSAATAPPVASVEQTGADAYDGPDADIVTPAGEYPIATEVVSLNIAMPSNAKISDYDNNDLTNYFEDKLGIEIVWNLLPSTAADAKSKIKLMFASDDLPDVFMGGQISDADIMDYADQGMLVPLDPYIEAFGEYIFDMWDTAADKKLKAIMTSPDGHIYSLPKYSEQYVNYYNMRCYLYTPFMENLGLEPATTTDEFKQLLIRFKEDDPNGNGEADEIAFIGHTNNLQWFQFLANPFVYWNNSNFLVVNDGVVDAAYTSDAFKDCLLYLRDLYVEGLINPLTFTQTEAELKTIMNQETHIVASFAQYTRTGVMDTASELGESWTAQPPLTGPDGVCWSTINPITAQHNFQITYKCKTPAVAYRFGDYMLSNEATMFSRYGVEGRDWEYVDPSSGKIGFDGEPAKTEYIGTTVWSRTSQNVHWQWPNPGFMAYGTNEGWVWDGDPNNYEYFQLNYGLTYNVGKQPEEMVPGQLVMTAEELDTYGLYNTQIQDYVKQSIAKFVVGDLDINAGWDAYLAEFDKLGLTEYLAAVQSCYTRMMG